MEIDVLESTESEEETILFSFIRRLVRLCFLIVGALLELEGDFSLIFK